MLFVTMNRLGQSGKTTLARYVLTPRLEGALMLSAESSTQDGAENLLIKSVGSGGAQTLGAALAGVTGLGRPVVLDVGSADTDVALPLILAHAAGGNATHVVIPFRAAAKAASAAVALLDDLQGKTGLLVSMVANCLEAAADLERDGYQAVAKMAEAKGAQLLSVGLVQNEWLHGAGKINSFEDIKGAAETDPSSLDKQCAAALKKGDLAALTSLGGQRARIEAAQRAIANTQAVFNALKTRHSAGSAEGLRRDR
ncbi:MAG TPA: hypothetical protein VFA39_20035 [Steroidobacteraceae bacterium]|nr:hypothetical protein [Steroidobacteraceae bacterium]